MTSPTDLARVPGVIPYVDNHDGPRRLLTIEIPSVGMGARLYVPVASIDGRQYVVSWGAVSFEIPADRNVHVSVHLQSNRGTDSVSTPFASTILPPHSAPMRLATVFSTGQEGTLTAVG